MTLAEIIRLRDPAGPKITKVLRHTDGDVDLNLLIQTNHLETYLANQGENRFPIGARIVSCLRDEGTDAILHGVYIVKSVKKDSTRSWPDSFPKKEMRPGEYWYDLERDTRFDDLTERLVINWGKDAINWCKALSDNQEIVRIEPRGLIATFPGFDQIVISHAQLKGIIDNPTAHRDWHSALRSVAAVYLITDSKDGAQYVGSAYGKDGLLKRWTDYAKNGHGGNKLLEALVTADPDAKSRFTYSVLKIFTSGLDKREALSVEDLYKRKLGSRAHGLNSN